MYSGVPHTWGSKPANISLDQVPLQSLLSKSDRWFISYTWSCLTCLSTNSLVSFSMWPSYRLVVMFIRPILERPKSVSLMWPIDVINKLLGERRRQCKRRILQFVKKMRIRAELQKNHDSTCARSQTQLCQRILMKARKARRKSWVKVMLEMSLLVRFKIPMHDAVVVKVLQSQDRLSKIHPGHFHRQWAHVFQQVGTISTLKEQNTLKNN